MKVFNEFNSKIKDYITSNFGESFVFLHYTGSMYGIGCLVDDEISIDKINKLKKRTGSKGYIILVPEIDFTQPDIEIRARQKMLIEQYWPGNLTITLKLKGTENNNAYHPLSLNNEIAVRCPNSKVLRDFIRNFKKPVISTSINSSGEEPYNNFENIRKLNWFDFAITENISEQNISNKPTSSTIVGFENDKIICHREGSIAFADIEKSYYHPQILFVCTGNICRSPMAEYYARDLITNKNLPFRTASSGVFSANRSISANSSMLLREDNIISESHIAQQIDRKLLADTWLILTMEQLHKEILLKTFPEMSHKIYTLAEYCDGSEDVSDPFTGDIELYNQTYSLIKQYLHKLVDKLELLIKE